MLVKLPCKVFGEINGGEETGTYQILDADGTVIFSGLKEELANGMCEVLNDTSRKEIKGDGTGQALPPIGDDDEERIGEPIPASDYEVESLLEPIAHATHGTDIAYDITGLGILNTVLNGLVPGLMMRIDPEEGVISFETVEALRVAVASKRGSFTDVIRKLADQLDGLDPNVRLIDPPDHPRGEEAEEVIPFPSIPDPADLPGDAELRDQFEKSLGIPKGLSEPRTSKPLVAPDNENTD